MPRRPSKGAGKGARHRATKAEADRAGGRQLVGVVLLLAAFLMIFPTGRTFYRWANRSGYVRTQVEIVDGANRNRRRTAVRVLSTGETLAIYASDFDELQKGGAITQAEAAPGDRFVAWYNPKAHVRLGIDLWDQRLVSAGRYPDLGDEGPLLGLFAVTLGLATAGAYLFRAPRRL